ncbi:hypothetical protein C789_1620 [Microcystis aeruginosa FACHB-905 = DIANCHI905]|nr:hypothetical protein C789_1620 [Microcystis aeruginosa FACHB-905 = DIANCHI905]
MSPNKVFRFIQQTLSREAQLFVALGWVSCFNPTYVHLNGFSITSDNR